MQLLINALIAGSLAALIAVGLSLVYGVLGVFNMALGQFVLLGGYLTWWLQSHGLSLVFAIPVSLIFSAVIAWISYKIFVQPFKDRHVFLPVATTIALSMILDALILLCFGEAPHAIVAPKTLLTIGSAVITVAQGILIVAVLTVLLILAFVMSSTSVGRRLRAAVSHTPAALSLGIRAEMLHTSLFVLSSICAAMAGIFIGIDQSLLPTLGFSMTVKAYAALIVGGKSSRLGVIVAAYAIALLEQLSVGLPWFGGSYISPSFQESVALFAILVFLLWKPEGFAGHSLRRS